MNPYNGSDIFEDYYSKEEDVTFQDQQN